MPEFSNEDADIEARHAVKIRTRKVPKIVACQFKLPYQIPFGVSRHDKKNWERGAPGDRWYFWYGDVVMTRVPNPIKEGDWIVRGPGSHHVLSDERFQKEYEIIE